MAKQDSDQVRSPRRVATAIVQFSWKSDILVPCNNCTKRRCTEVCPERTLPSSRRNYGASEQRSSVSSAAAQRASIEHRPVLPNAEPMLEPGILAAQIPAPQASTTPLAPITSAAPLPTSSERSSAVAEVLSTQPNLFTHPNPLGNSGTLVVKPDGRSKFIGPSVHSQFLQEASLVSLALRLTVECGRQCRTAVAHVLSGSLTNC